MLDQAAQMRPNPKDASPQDGYNDATDTADKPAPPDNESPAENQGEPGEEPGDAAGTSDAQYDAIMKKIAQAVILALKQPNMKQQLVQAVQGQDPASGLANLAYGIMQGLDHQSGGALPEDCAIGAASIVLGMLAELATAIGVKIDQQVIAQASGQMMQRFLSEAGASPQQIDQAKQAMNAPGGPDAPQGNPGAPPNDAAQGA